MNLQVSTLLWKHQTTCGRQDFAINASCGWVEAMIALRAGCSCQVSVVLVLWGVSHGGSVSGPQFQGRNFDSWFCQASCMATKPKPNSGRSPKQALFELAARSPNQALCSLLSAVRRGVAKDVALDLLREGALRGGPKGWKTA